MKTGDKVVIQPALQMLAGGILKNTEANGTIFEINDENTVMKLLINEPPDWFRMELQKRGVFIGEKTEWMMFLFLDHKRQWTDYQTANHYWIAETGEEV